MHIQLKPVKRATAARYSMIIFTGSLKSGQRAWTDVTRVAKTAVLQVRNNGVIVQDSNTLYVAAIIT